MIPALGENYSKQHDKIEPKQNPACMYVRPPLTAHLHLLLPQSEDSVEGEQSYHAFVRLVEDIIPPLFDKRNVAGVGLLTAAGLMNPDPYISGIKRRPDHDLGRCNRETAHNCSHSGVLRGDTAQRISMNIRRSRSFMFK